MLLLGIVILLAAGSATGTLVAFNLSDSPDYTWTAFGTDLVTIDAVFTLLAGFALGLVFCLGLALIVAGARRGRRRAARLREAERQAAQAAAERDALADRLAAEEARRESDESYDEPYAAPEPDSRWTPRERVGRMSGEQR